MADEASLSCIWVDAALAAQGTEVSLVERSTSKHQRAGGDTATETEVSGRGHHVGLHAHDTPAAQRRAVAHRELLLERECERKAADMDDT